MTGPRAAHLALSLAVVAVFAPGVGHPLLPGWDDGRFILDNPHVQRVSLEGLRAFFTQVHFEAYHPLHLLSYWLDVPLFGARGPVLHTTNLLLWIVASNLVLRAMLALGLSTPAALLGAAVCCLHPVQVEAVGWASGRKDVLALGLSACVLLCHARSSHWLDRWSWGARACLAAALLSKTTTVPLPLFLLAWDVLLRGRRLSAALRFQLPGALLSAAAAAGVVSIWSRSEMLGEGGAGLAALSARVANTLAWQLQTALWPARTAPMYPDVGLEHATLWGIGAALLLYLGLLGAYLGRARALLFTLAAFGALALPVSNAIAMHFPWQDRYLSLPLLPLGFGLAALMDWSARRWSRARLPLGAVALSLVFALGLRTVQYGAAWKSERRLWEHAVVAQPGARLAWLKLGQVRRDQGELEGAVAAMRRSLCLHDGRGAVPAQLSLMHALVLLDERGSASDRSSADVYASLFAARLDDADGLRALARRLESSGHPRAAELAADRARRRVAPAMHGGCQGDVRAQAAPAALGRLRMAAPRRMESVR